MNPEMMTDTGAGLGEYWAAMPGWLAALAILVAGRLLAGAVRFAAGRALERARFDGLCDKMGLSEFLRKGDVSYTPSRLAGMAAYWAILLLALLAAFHQMGVAVAMNLARRLEAVLPALVTAAGVLVFGLIAVFFLAKVARTLARNAGFAFSDLLYKTIRWIGVFLVLGMAVEQLGLDVRFLLDTARIMVAAAAFGLALAFGLGCKDIARDAMRKFIDNMKESGRSSKSDLEG